MRLFLLLARVLSILVGLAILGATAHVSILANGGYGAPFSYVIITVTGGVACGCIAVGACIAEGRTRVALVIMTMMIAGEAFAFMSTAERLITSRAEAQEPLRIQEEAREKAKARVAAAEAAVAAIPDTTERIRKAEAAKAAADQAVLEKSAERNCASNCRALLQAQVDAAQAELDAARDALRDRRDAAQRELMLARAALDGMEVTRSASPFADSIGVPPWVVDLFHSAFGSLAANGLAWSLLFFGSHVPRRARVEIIETTATTQPVILQEKPKPQAGRKPTPRNHAAQFGVECLDPGGEADIQDIRRQYRIWCERRGDTPLPAKQIGEALADLFEETGIEVVDRDGRLVAIGVSISEPQQKALGHMTTVGRS